METNVKAVWQGSFKKGNGQLNIENSGIDKVAFKSVFAKSDGNFTNPEELLASAHATCYTMALSYILSENGFTADDLETQVSLVIDNNVITNSNLELKAKITGIDEDSFQKFADKAKEMCVVGNALKVQISLEASLI